MAQNSYRSIEAANLHVPSTDRPWLIARDAPANAREFSAYGSFENLIDIEAAALVSASNNSVSFSQAKTYISRRGYCIDPLFWSSQPVEPPNLQIPVPHPRDAALDFPYRRSRFPHYHELYNPVYDPVTVKAQSPKLDIVSNISFIEDTSPPRMMRITYAASPFAPYIPARARFAESLFASTDDVTNPLSSGDRSLNGIRGYFTQGSGMAQGENLMQVASSQGISWMATLAPLEQAGNIVNNQFRLSVILFANRDRSFDASGIGLDIKTLPNSEQIAWAFQPDFVTGLTKPPMGPTVPLSNEYSYCGENGFAVDLYWNSAYATPVKVGDWVMLSRRWRTAANSGNTMLDELNTIQLHRWYRVVSAMTPQVGVPAVQLPHTASNPGGVTRQSVQLLGPDWYFQAPLASNDPQQRPTQATIVRGVSAVYERTVTIPMD
jgi:hypothetical protein